MVRIRCLAGGTAARGATTTFCGIFRKMQFFHKYLVVCVQKPLNLGVGSVIVEYSMQFVRPVAFGAVVQGWARVLLARRFPLEFGPEKRVAEEMQIWPLCSMKKCRT